MKRKILSLGAALLVLLTLAGCLPQLSAPQSPLSPETVPPYSGEPFAVLNGNQPEFAPEDMTKKSYEYYSPLDSLGRCGYTMACIGMDLMPTEDRESISMVKPSGWEQNFYDFVDGQALYNRCHLIGFQLTGENANERNLVTGTRYCNTQGMLPFENMVADYIKETGNHVLYRVTPIFRDSELVARGIQMEAWSVEDEGEGICYNVYVYNVQPGVVIDYATGENRPASQEQTSAPAGRQTYILNVSSMKFHKGDCAQGQAIKDKNKELYTGDRQTLLDRGYVPSGCCKP